MKYWPFALIGIGLLIVGAVGTLTVRVMNSSGADDYTDEELYCSVSDPAGETEYCSRVLAQRAQRELLLRPLFLVLLVAGIVLIPIGLIPKLKRLRWE
jgi:hypothetical protein